MPARRPSPKPARSGARPATVFSPLCITRSPLPGRARPRCQPRQHATRAPRGQDLARPQPRWQSVRARLMPRCICLLHGHCRACPASPGNPPAGPRLAREGDAPDQVQDDQKKRISHMRQCAGPAASTKSKAPCARHPEHSHAATPALAMSGHAWVDWRARQSALEPKPAWRCPGHRCPVERRRCAAERRRRRRPPPVLSARERPLIRRSSDRTSSERQRPGCVAACRRASLH